MRLIRGLGLFWLLCVLSIAAIADDAAWNRLREGGYIVLMRHAQTEAGVGDPPGFALSNCSTQRNLSAEGRAQARRTGEAFRHYGIAVREVRSSAWCRCLDTARLAFNQVTVWSELNSFFDAPGRREAQTAAVVTGLRDASGPGNLVLVTHQVNITALTGQPASPGELIIVRPPQAPGYKLNVVGTLHVP